MFSVNSEVSVKKDFLLSILISTEVFVLLSGTPHNVRNSLEIFVVVNFVVVNFLLT